ncbi:MAG: phosphoribosyltransferase family protein [Persephonella sp.]|nr:phosphoribosyltransferase family protein [Persephonella sp.]
MEEAKEKMSKYLKGKEPDIKDKTVIIVDDGIATGYTALVAGMYAKNRGASKVILAVPVCPSDSIKKAEEIFDRVICYNKVSSPFFAVGAYYQDFHQISDSELQNYITEAESKGLYYK